MALSQRIWSQLVRPSDPVARAELLNQKLRQREINELEALLMLSPDDDASNVPHMWDLEMQNAFFKGMAWGVGITMYFVVYGFGLLHV